MAHVLSAETPFSSQNKMFFVGGETTVHHFLVLFNLSGTCAMPHHFHWAQQVCSCPEGKQDLEISIKNIVKLIII